MDIRVRRIVVVIFVAFFLIASPLLILYGLGYKYNWQKHRLERTGVFFIKSFPRNADIYVDNKKYKKDTPTRITRLLPKVYNIKIVKENYSSWQKSLTVWPQMTTFIEDVSLIYKEPKFEMLLKGKFTDFLISPNRRQIALVEKDDESQIVWLYSLVNDSFTELYKTDVLNKIQVISWSFSNKKILIEQNNDYLIINADKPGTVHSLSKLAKVNLNNVKWDSYNDNILYALNKNRLLKINVIENDFIQLNKDTILNYYPYKTKLIGISKNQNKYYLNIYSNSEVEVLFSLPYSESYQFKRTTTDFLILFDNQQQQLYLLNPEDKNQPVKFLLKNISDFKWHNKQFIYWNSSELWVSYLESNEKILLERTSQKIQNAFWHPNAVYVYAVTGDKLKLYELDSRDQRNVYELLTINKGEEKFLATNKKGDYLYLITKINEKAGFYKVEIQ